MNPSGEASSDPNAIHISIMILVSQCHFSFNAALFLEEKQRFAWLIESNVNFAFGYLTVMAVNFKLISI